MDEDAADAAGAPPACAAGSAPDAVLAGTGGPAGTEASAAARGPEESAPGHVSATGTVGAPAEGRGAAPDPGVESARAMNFTRMPSTSTMPWRRYSLTPGAPPASG
jgi:hypothetical protein